MFSSYSRNWWSTEYLCGVRGAWISVDRGESEREKLGNLPDLMVCKLISSPVTVGENTHTWLFAWLQKQRWQILIWVPWMSRAPVSPVRKTEQMGVSVLSVYVYTFCIYEGNTVCYSQDLKQKQGESWGEKKSMLPFAFADLFSGKNYYTHPFFPSPFLLFQVILGTVSWIS